MKENNAQHIWSFYNINTTYKGIIINQNNELKG